MSLINYFSVSNLDDSAIRSSDALVDKLGVSTELECFLTHVTRSVGALPLKPGHVRSCQSLPLMCKVSCYKSCCALWTTSG